MEFDQNYETRNFDKSQIQYLIMNNFPQENWYIAEKSKDSLIENLEGYLNRTYNETQMKFDASLQYQFTRGSPKTALTPSGS
jgi:predicted RNA-binding protein with PIN domain